MIPFSRPAPELLERFHFRETGIQNIFVTQIVPGTVSMLLCFPGRVSLIDEPTTVDLEQLAEMDVMELMQECPDDYIFRLNKVAIKDDSELEFMLNSVFGLPV